MFAKTLTWLIATTIVLVSSGCDLNPVTPETARGTIHVYTSKRCSACRMAKPVIEKLKNQGFRIREIDVAKHPRKAGKARVHMIPTFIHYLNGKETDRIVGTASEMELNRMYR